MTGRWAIFWVVVFLFVFFAGTTPAAAQGGQPGTLRGQVFDETGAVIPGATVSARHDKGRERTTVTDPSGVYTLTGVEPGMNSLTVRANGFALSQQLITVKPGVQELPPVKLMVAAVESTVVVEANTGVPTVDPSDNLGAIVIDEDMLATLPEDREELLLLLQELAGPAAGANGGAGAQFIIDGFRGGRLPPKADIQRIRINANPMSAEFSQPGHSRIEITTKPGRDRFGGHLTTGYNNALFNARQPFSPTRPPSYQRRYDASVHGPLIAKRASFSAHLEHNNLQNHESVVATILSGGLITPFNATVLHPRQETDFNIRTDWLLWGDKTINLKFAFDDDESENQGVGDFTLPERATHFRSRRYTLQAGNLWVFSSRVLNEARAQLRRHHLSQSALSSGHAINVVEAFYGGGSPQGLARTTTDALEFHDNLSVSYKKHTLRLGVQADLEHLDSLRMTNYNGTFTFSNLDQYRRARLGESTFDPARGDRSPPQFSITRGDPFLGFSTMEFAWFVNDDVMLRRNLTLSAGLRHEFQAWLPDRNNWAPRLGLAWSPKTARRTVLRAGWGLFYNRLGPGLIDSVIRQQRQRQEQLIIRGTSAVNIFPDPYVLPPTPANRILTERTFAGDLRAPYSIQWSASVEHLLPRGVVATVSYLRSRGVHLYRLRNLNAPVVGGQGAGESARPDPGRGNVQAVESTGLSIFDMISVQVQRRLTRLATLSGNYTLSYARGDVAGNARGSSLGSLPANNYDLHGEWGPASFDQRHRLFVNGSVSLPWRLRLHTMFNYGSPMPFNITTGSDDNQDTSYTDRPGGVGRNASLPEALYMAINPNQTVLFARRQAGFLPEALRARYDTDPTKDSFRVPVRALLDAVYPNGVRARGPNSINMNLRLSKTIGFCERLTPASRASVSGGGAAGAGAGGRGGRQGGDLSGPKGPSRGEGLAGKAGKAGGARGERNASYRYNLTFSISAHNLFNRVNYGNYVGTLTSPYFGRANSARGARRVEFQLNWNF